MKDIVIIGSGGLAREVAWLLEENNKHKNEWNILGFVSDERTGTEVGNYTVLGDDGWLLNRSRLIHAACCVGDGGLRKRIVSKLKENRLIRFPNLVAHDTTVADSVKLGEGCIITKASVLTIDITIGDFVVSNLGTTIGHDCVIGNFVTLNPGSHISGNVRLGDGVMIGTGAVIIQGITVGDDVTVGAGASVIRDIAPGTVAVGVPARPVIRR